METKESLITFLKQSLPDLLFKPEFKCIDPTKKTINESLMEMCFLNRLNQCEELDRLYEGKSSRNGEYLTGRNILAELYADTYLDDIPKYSEKGLRYRRMYRGFVKVLNKLEKEDN